MAQTGLTYLLRGFQSLTKPGLKRYVIIPVIINILLFSVLIVLGLHWINHFTTLLPHWLHWLAWLFDALFFLVVGIILIYAFTIITNLIGAPFNSFLSAKVQLVTTGSKFYENDSMFNSLKDIPRSVKREGQKIWYYLPRALVLLILFIIPVINIIASLIWLVFGSWMMAIEYLDYPMDNHKQTFKESYQHLRKHCLSSLGFGFCVMIASMIPVVNFFVMPAAVIGATLMYLDQIKEPM